MIQVGSRVATQIRERGHQVAVGRAGGFGAGGVCDRSSPPVPVAGRQILHPAIDGGGVHAGRFGDPRLQQIGELLPGHRLDQCTEHEIVCAAVPVFSRRTRAIQLLGGVGDTEVLVIALR